MTAFMDRMADASADRRFRVEEWRGEEHILVAFGNADSGDGWASVMMDHAKGWVRVRGWPSETQARKAAEAETCMDLYGGLSVSAAVRASDLAQGD